MSLHPDADALVRASLDHPTDETPRLVLADWLDDTGRPEDAAWAGYIRARAAAARAPANGSLRNEYLREALSCSSGIVATLTVGAAHLVRHPAPFLDLLPAEHLTVRLDGADLPLDAVELVPESVARENRVVPLAATNMTLYLAAADPTVPVMIQRLEFILNRNIVPIRAGADEIDRAIEAHYPWAEVESVTEELVEFPGDPWPSSWADDPGGRPVGELVNLILLDAVRFDADWVEITPEGDRARVQYRVEDDWVARPALPRHMLAAVAARLAEQAGITPGAADGQPGDGTITFDTGVVRAAFAVMVVPLPAGPWVWIERVVEPAALA